MFGSYLNSGYLRPDLMGGLTTAVVALPLALAFGVASGAGPGAGVYGAIFVGFFAAIFGGTPCQVSGPTGPMTVVMAGVFASLHANYPDSAMTIGFGAVILAGLMQIGMGLLKLGKYFILVPYPVISGFMTGIGVIIILLQLAPLLGHSGQATLTDTLLNIPIWLQMISWPALSLGMLSLSVVFFWPSRLASWCPAPLAALLVGTACYLLLLPADAVAVIGDIPTGFPALHWPAVPLEVLGELFYAALLLAMLGSIDSLLTSLVADNLTRTQHNSDRELIGQGIGNTVAGFFGGLPGAGATMRTVVNIRSGAKTGFSGAFHSLVLLAIMLGAGKYAAVVPLSVLAGILLKVGIDIIDWSYLSRLRSLPTMPVVLMLVVLLMTVFVDLISAVIVGVFIYNLITIERLTSIQLDSVCLSDGISTMHAVGPQEEAWLQGQQGRVLLLQLAGPLSFAVGRGLRGYLSSYQSHRLLIIDVTGAQLVGISTAMILDEVISAELDQGRVVALAGMSDKVEASLLRLGTLERLGAQWIFPRLPAAMERAEASSADAS